MRNAHENKRPACARSFVRHVHCPVKYYINAIDSIGQYEFRPVKPLICLTRRRPPGPRALMLELAEEVGETVKLSTMRGRKAVRASSLAWRTRSVRVVEPTSLREQLFASHATRGGRFKVWFSSSGFHVANNTPAQAAGLLRAEQAKRRAVVKASGTRDE